MLPFSIQLLAFAAIWVTLALPVQGVKIYCAAGRLSVVDAVDVDHRHSLVQKLLSYEHAFILDNMEYVGNFAQCRVNQKETGEEISTEALALWF